MGPLIELECKVNKNLLFKYQMVYNNTSPDIQQLVKVAEEELINLLDKGIYKDISLIEAIKNNKFEGWMN